MNRRLLKYFQAIAEYGSFSGAAARIGVAQPALSRHIKGLEEELGTPLLLRSAKGVRPTEAGEALLEWANRIEHSFEQAVEEVQSVGRVPRGVVRLGLPGTISNILSAPLIAASHHRFPGIRIVIAEAMSGYVEEWMLDGRVDIALLYEMTRHEGVSWYKLLEEELVVIHSPSAGFPDKPVLRDLMSVPLILTSRVHGLRRTINTVFSESGVEIDPAFEVDSYPSIIQLVSENLGHSILPRHAVRREAEDGMILIKRLADAPMTRTVYMANMTGRPLGRAGEEVRGLILSQVASTISSGRWAGATDRTKRD